MAAKCHEPPRNRAHGTPSELSNTSDQRDFSQCLQPTLKQPSVVVAFDVVRFILEYRLSKSSSVRVDQGL